MAKLRKKNLNVKRSSQSYMIKETVLLPFVGTRRQPHAARFSRAARAARYLEQRNLSISPDSLRCSATNVSGIARQPPESLLLT